MTAWVPARTFAETTRVTFPALGTTAWIVALDAWSLPAARAAVATTLDEVDAACSRFRADSELARVNRAAGRWVQVGELLREALAVALRAAASTDGIVDPTVGGALVALGYDRDYRTTRPAPEPAFTPRPAGRWREVELDAERSRVRVPRGVSLDLGATAKALAADRAAASAAVRAGSILVSLGGDVSVAGTAPDEGWAIRVSDDHRSPIEAPGQTVSIASGGLATSSTIVRAWRRGGRSVHHIVDPATGVPARPVWRTVSVAAESCVDANIASTAAIVRGEAAVDWLERRHLPARLVRPSGSVVTCGGWPAEGSGGASTA